MSVPRRVKVPVPSRDRYVVGAELAGMGLAEAHYNRRGKALRLAHGIYSAPCEAFYHAGTGGAMNSYSGRYCTGLGQRKGVLRRARNGRNDARRGTFPRRD